jgi:hypothetical protein
VYTVPTDFVDLAQTCQVMAAVHELLFGADAPLTEMLTEWFLYITGGTATREIRWDNYKVWQPWTR